MEGHSRANLILEVKMGLKSLCHETLLSNLMHLREPVFKQQVIVIRFSDHAITITIFTLFVA